LIGPLLTDCVEKLPEPDKRGRRILPPRPVGKIDSRRGLVLESILRQNTRSGPGPGPRSGQGTPCFEFHVQTNGLTSY
jgi:hypothetical protein